MNEPKPVLRATTIFVDAILLLKTNDTNWGPFR